MPLHSPASSCSRSCGRVLPGAGVDARLASASSSRCCKPPPGCGRCAPRACRRSSCAASRRAHVHSSPRRSSGSSFSSLGSLSFQPLAAAILIGHALLADALAKPVLVALRHTVLRCAPVLRVSLRMNGQNLVSLLMRHLLLKHLAPAVVVGHALFSEHQPKRSVVISVRLIHE